MISSWVNYIWLIFFKEYCICTGQVPDPTSLFPPDLILYINLVTKGAPKFVKTLAPRLTVLDIPYFADAYSSQANTQNPVGHDSAV